MYSNLCLQCSGVVPGIDADVGCGGGGCWLVTSAHCFAAAAYGWFAAAAAVCLSRCPGRYSSTPSSERRLNGSRLPAVSQPVTTKNAVIRYASLQLNSFF